MKQEHAVIQQDQEEDIKGFSWIDSIMLGIKDNVSLQITVNSWPTKLYLNDRITCFLWISMQNWLHQEGSIRIALSYDLLVLWGNIISCVRL